MKITEKTFNIATSEETIIERNETATETKTRLDYEKEITKLATLQAEVDAAKAVAQAKLAALGLTTDDLKALGL